MMVLWITLLLFQQAYLLSPLKAVGAGEPATLTCAYTDIYSVRWFKQSVGETLRLIVTLNRFKAPAYEPEFNDPRLDAKMEESLSRLNIRRTRRDDEGMYHCAAFDWMVSTWSSTYLSVTGSSERTSNLSVVQQPSVSDPVRPGASVSLQCSVLSDSDSPTCPGGHSVIWFRAGSDGSHPDIIYTDETRSHGCEQRPEAERSCVHHFSKNVSSSDAGTYYCAVTTCGRILFGDGTKVDIAQPAGPGWIVLGILSVCLVVSAVGNVLLLCKQKQHKGLQRAASEAEVDDTHLQTDADDELNYALDFSMKQTRGRKKREFTGDGVYAHVRC